MSDPPLLHRNLAINTTFTSTPSEHAFFLLSLLCELHAPTLLRLMSATLDELFFADSLAFPRIERNLVQTAAIIDELSGLLAAAMKASQGPTTNATVVPACFYWEIRPWFNGGRWMYEGEAHWNDREGEWGGPSAGQSSLIHAVDVFLGVDHSPRGNSAPPAPLARPADVRRAKRPSTDDTFMLRASLYMPAHHRDFLLHLASLSHLSHLNPHPLPSIRSLAQRYPNQLGTAYDLAVTAMKRFRDEHMKIATRYIVTQARTEPARDSVFWPEYEVKRVVKAEEQRLKIAGEAETHTGTGGTELVTFLKACRTRTQEALLLQ